MTPTRRSDRGRRFRAILVRTLLLLVVAVVLVAFPYGPLFPWSPWKPGYDRLTLTRADVFFPAGTTLPEAFRHVDEYIRESERFHGLPVTFRLRIVLCRNWADFWRFLPHMRGRVIGAAALETGTVVYVTPRIAEKGYDHGEFLRHEISHATIHQNQSLWQAFKTAHAESFFEGLAVSFGRQRAFVPLPEALAYVRDHDVAAVFAPDDGRPRNMRLNYQVWRLFVEYLRDAGGPNRFHALLRRTMVDPDGYAASLRQTYAMSYEAALEHFRTAVRAGWAGRAVQ